MNYLQATLKQIKKNSNDIQNERNKAQEGLRNSYKTLLPYISSLTHYYRNGYTLMNIYIFNQTYDQIQKQIQK